MEKEESAKFIQYMAKKPNVKTQAELETALTSMGEEKLKAAYEEFKAQPSYRSGGKLDYLGCLKKFKKGGVVDCGCGKKLKKGGVVKAQWGAILGAAKGVMSGAKTAGALAKGASTAMKVGKGLQTAGKVLNGANAVYGAYKSATTPTTQQPQMVQLMPTQQVAMNPPVPAAYNPIRAQNTPTLSQQSIPTLNPAPTPILTKPLYSEDGGKLKKLNDLKKIKKHQQGGKLSEFGAAFKASRAAGEKEFTFKGKRYNTRTEDEEDKAVAGKTNMVPKATVTAKKPIGKNIDVAEVKVTAKRPVPKTNVPEAKIVASRYGEGKTTPLATITAKRKA